MAGGASVLTKTGTVVTIAVTADLVWEVERVIHWFFDGQGISKNISLVDPGKIVLSFVIDVIPLSHSISSHKDVVVFFIRQVGFGSMSQLSSIPVPWYK
jgi:hypothetical protein